MAHSCFIDINSQQKQNLLDIAARSIDSGLANGSPLDININEYQGILTQPAGAFVTLTIDGELRGCIGSLEASEPLVQSISRNAYNAAFCDPRFSKLSVAERSLIKIEISILSEMMPMFVTTRQALLENLKPGEDGLLLEYKHHRATFLPQVWDKLSDPQDFLEQLMLKAGLASNFWSDSIKFYRYYSYSFEE